ncbi:MAG: hypothetical protein ABFD94_08310, partial [Armatimonadia bacterium]
IDRQLTDLYPRGTHKRANCRQVWSEQVGLVHRQGGQKPRKMDQAQALPSRQQTKQNDLIGPFWRGRG